MDNPKQIAAVKDLANAFLNAKQSLLDAGELSPRTWDDYKAIHDSPELLAKFDALNAFRSSAAGYLRYFQTRG